MFRALDTGNYYIREAPTLPLTSLLDITILVLIRVHSVLVADGMHTCVQHASVSEQGGGGQFRSLSAADCRVVGLDSSQSFCLGLGWHAVSGATSTIEIRSTSTYVVQSSNGAFQQTVVISWMS